LQGARSTGLPIVTEAIDAESLELVAEYADIIQIGGAQYAELQPSPLRRQARKPVLLKRGMSATLDDFLLAAGT